MRQTRTPSRFTLLTLGVATLALWLTFLSFPFPTNNTLDAAWQSVLVHAHGQPWLFGRDLIFTFGPWGFLTVLFHPGGPLWPKIIWELAGKLIFAATFAGFSLRLSVWRRWAFLAAVLLFANFFTDTLYLLFLALVVLELLRHPGGHGGKLAAGAAALAVLAQFKFTYTLLAAFGVAVVVLALLLDKRWRRAVLTAAVFAAVWLGLWLAAGQSLAKVPNYFRYSWQIAIGYSPAMAFDESWPVFLCGSLALVCAALYGLALLRTPAKSWTTRLTAVFLLGAWFLVWKHGFTRADGHVMGFFVFTLWLALALPPLFRPARAWWLGGAALLCLAGIQQAGGGLLASSPRQVWPQIAQNAKILLHPVRFSADFHRALAENERTFGLPAVKALVGGASVDVFNYEQGAVLLSGLNYQPRPIFQSYSAYTPALLSKNLGYYRGPHAPEFVLFQLQTIDDRFPTQDDSLLLAALPLRYTFDRDVDGFLVGRKKDAPPRVLATAREFIASLPAPLGENVPVPVLRDHAVWVVMDLPLSWLGRLRALLYRPPILHLVVTDVTGGETSFRVIPPVAAEGFLLNPFLETQSDYAAFAQGRGQKWIQSIRLEAEPGEAEFWGAPTVDFFSLPALPVDSSNPWDKLVKAGVTNLAPLTAEAAYPVEQISFDGRPAVFVHAPGALVFVPRPGTHTLSGAFGIKPGAYQNGNRTDGVDFVITADFADGHTETLYRRWLDPLNHPQDRGAHSFEVGWQGPAPVRVTLKTLPRTGHNNSWDWACWSGLSFQP